MTRSQMGLGDYALPRALRALPAAYRGRGYDLVEGEAVATMERLPDASVDLVFADPPYRLSNGGTTCRAGERVAVGKGAWDESDGLHSDHDFNRRWLAAARRVLKPSGTIWVSGTQHVIFSIGFAMQSMGYHLLNTVTWFKPNASPNLGCRQLTHSTELIIWAAPAAYDPLPHTFNYRELREENGGVQMRDLWKIPAPGAAERTHGRHPTQKPLALLDRIVATCTQPGDVVLDPFNGSGTTGVVAVAGRRRYIGVDLKRRYLDLTARRLAHPDAPPAPAEPEDEEEAR